MSTLVILKAFYGDVPDCTSSGYWDFYGVVEANGGGEIPCGASVESMLEPICDDENSCSFIVEDATFKSVDCTGDDFYVEWDCCKYKELFCTLILFR